MRKTLLFLFISIVPLLLTAQNTQLLQQVNGFKDIKLGMTIDDINKLGVFTIPPKQQQYMLAEANNPMVTYTGFPDLDKIEAFRNNGYAYYLNRPFKYIGMVFAADFLVRIFIMYTDEYSDNNAALLEHSNKYFGVATKVEGGKKTGELIAGITRYYAESNGSNTTITFEMNGGNNNGTNTNTATGTNTGTTNNNFEDFSCNTLKNIVADFSVGNIGKYKGVMIKKGEYSTEFKSTVSLNGFTKAEVSTSDISNSFEVTTAFTDLGTVQSQFKILKSKLTECFGYLYTSENNQRDELPGIIFKSKMSSNLEVWLNAYKTNDGSSYFLSVYIVKEKL